MSLNVEPYDEATDSIVIEGTRYAGVLFREFGCGFPNNIGSTLRIVKKENGTVTVTNMGNCERDLAEAQRGLAACQNAIAWALGENGEFEPDSDEPLRPDGTPIARYWWRSKLRKMRVAELLAQEGGK